MIDNTTPTPPESARVAFEPATLEPGDQARAWGFVNADNACIGVMYQRTPQPHLSFYPPVRVPEGRIDAFLEACLEHARGGGADGWLLLSVDPQDGEVSLRMNLASDEIDEIDLTVERACSFLSEAQGDLARICIPGNVGDGNEDGDEDAEDKSFLDRFFGL